LGGGWLTVADEVSASMAQGNKQRSSRI